ncbi:hypothetical protein E2C01_011246 [Portunus trituberculatus]|uniref:Uncharacterized protein n=1 Tax=Portunus trituberculatus TaxID=210409 RepID=A0A5B7DAK4_PORTR|nr:hypothetical protein [Portunus trituberculatus]
MSPLIGRSGCLRMTLFQDSVWPVHRSRGGNVCRRNTSIEECNGCPNATADALTLAGPLLPFQHHRSPTPAAYAFVNTAHESSFV